MMQQSWRFEKESVPCHFSPSYFCPFVLSAKLAINENWIDNGIVRSVNSARFDNNCIGLQILAAYDSYGAVSR